MGAFDLVILNKTGGNAAHFFQRIFWGHLTLALFDSYRGKCCPFFSKNFLGAFDPWHFLTLTGENAAHFFREKFFGHLTFAIF